ncbi:hypothetical protein BKA58DRAFT_410175 [Alternaria rosae]|uniref:uncharacterized protein n=1 Tax=Alternaria rosae TaxID=1187941 RepID=UPI001E8DE2DD|nr:uncharacterized protein BKA58DRAFT_410175 [Alternaria rosae]KAH6876044.1 hypothetical protein BKA58DRAFT_410175 [Alternaria rosae]
MRLSPEAEAYRQHILNYAARSYTRTLFFGYHYRFLAELLRADEAHLPKQHSDLEAYHLGYLSVGHAYLSNLQFVIEQDVSITIESNGDGWTDVGSRDLSQSRTYHHFIEYMAAKTETGRRDIRLLPVHVLGQESRIKNPWPLPFPDPDNPQATDDSLFQTAYHLPSELHVMLDDHEIAGQDPLYALAPILLFAAASEIQLLSTLQKWYDIIASTKWDRKYSTEHMEQLIMHKHLLDDHASRHEEVLRFISSPKLARWAANLTQDQSDVAQEAKDAVKADYEFLRSRYRQLSLHYQEAITILVSATSLAESQKQITLATQVTKLTILATIFLPLSYCTSIFGMNFVELDHGMRGKDCGGFGLR